MSTQEIGKVKYIYEMTLELEWGNPDEIKEVIKKAQDRGLISLNEEEDKIKLNYDYTYFDIIPHENRKLELNKIKEKELEKPIKTANTEREIAINKLVEEHGIEPRIATSYINQIEDIDDSDETAKEVISKIRNYK